MKITNTQGKKRHLGSQKTDPENYQTHSDLSKAAKQEIQNIWLDIKEQK